MSESMLKSGMAGGLHGAERDYKARAAVISDHCDSKGEPSAHTP